MVRLNIFQEVTKVDELATITTQNIIAPTTFKRTIETTVIVKDKQTVVIGGLIDDSITQTDYKVPCLGDVPLLGWIGHSISDSSEKTNLFVFLTPKVVQNPAEATDIYKKKKDQIDAVKEGRVKMYDVKPKNR